VTVANSAMPNKDESENRGVVLGVVLIAVAVLPQIYWAFIGYENVPDVQNAAWGFCISSILLASYFFPDKSFLFRALLWIFRTIHLPRGEWLAIVYAGLIALISIVHLVR